MGRIRIRSRASSSRFSPGLRVFIGNAAKSKAASLDQDSLEDRKYGYKPHCPICGGDPVMARISETNFNGSVRSLVCGTCGASWYWNRIGCPYCETNATRDLRYVHDKDDLDHRLYVCDHCGEIPRPCSSTRMNLTGLRTSLSS
ncbi:hypothetical protein MESMUL_22980 [Mesosutterella multiformis]|uniref:FdhE central domain-containing protein n=2 Tax=Mesosutterella multiformis TaxID=2259133 RepID=A0A388SJL3_9BURK|nr:hypothetical protein MESMUL_22980 [Mesosutterella multiformis]